MQHGLDLKPLHHIDTSVFLESEKTIDGRFCRKYMQKVGYNYYGKFSLPTLGEMMISILLVKDYSKRYTLLDLITALKTARKIDIYTPIEIGDIHRKIREIDTRLNPTDIDIVACAIEDGAKNLVTLDKDLIGNRTIESEFRLRISHPRDLL